MKWANKNNRHSEGNRFKTKNFCFAPASKNGRFFIIIPVLHNKHWALESVITALITTSF